MRTVQDTFIKTRGKVGGNDFWLNLLEGEIKYSSFLLVNIKNKPSRYKDFKFEFSNNLLKDFVNKRQNSEIVLLSVLKVLLYKYTSNNDVIIMIPVKTELNYNNSKNKSLFIRSFIHEDMTMDEIENDLKILLNKIYKNQNINLEEIMKELELEQDLTDILFAFNYNGIEDIAKKSNCNIIFNFNIIEDNFIVEIKYNSQIYNEFFVNQLCRHFELVLVFALNSKLEKVKNLKLMNNQEINLYNNLINSTSTSWNYNKSIVELFHEQVEKNPLSLAIKSQKVEISYIRLEEVSNKLSNLLIKRGVKKGDFIPIIAERSCEMIVGMLGVLKTGSCFVPISNKLPKERRDFILEDCNAKIVLIQKKDFLFKEDNYESIVLDLDKNSFFLEEKNFIGVLPEGEDLAYVLYTSGTTGNPKGVLIKNNSVVNLSYWFGKTFHLDSNKNILHMTDISFDVSIEETIVTLLNGAQIFIIPEEIKLNKYYFESYLIDNSINIAQFVPVTLRELLPKNKKIRSLDVIICGGDKLNSKLKDEVLNLGYSLYNNYGPTETTVDAISTKCEKELDVIGKPISNTEIYICNEFEEILPIGVIGEIYISGVGLSDGYLNRNELTDEKFIFNKLLLKKVYKTGDLARCLPNGNIEFIGRKDNQVKINGVRIELDDIETRLSKFELIEEAAVITKTSKKGDLYICAFYTAKNEISSENFRNYLGKYYPSYMIPKYFIKIEKFDVSYNQKINKKNLVHIKLEVNDNLCIQPRNSIERKLIDIWKNNLGVEHIGITDKFINLGGDSLIATSIVNEIQKVLCSKFTLIDFHNNISIVEISKIINNLDEKTLLKQLNNNIILLKKGYKENLNLFFIHAGNGEIDVYKNLSKILNNNYNYWGIRANCIESYCPINITIPLVASQYIEELKKIQSNGPYFILGWCIGGSIAYEIALQLESLGEKVEFLGLVNSFAPDKKFWGSVSDFTFQSEIEEAMRFIGESSIETILEKKESIEEIWDYTVTLLENRKFDCNLIKKRVLDDMDRAIPHFKDVLKIKTIIYYVNILRTFDRGRALYYPNSFVNVSINFFSACYERAANGYNWKNFTNSKFNYYEVPGDNFSVFLEPNVQIMAEKINQILNIYIS
ncbi:non-ribosomal peptide synthetase [Anaerosacchariphilus polymeriproducens]|uniref:Amino acid adenylation domain-containing protein n=1 Tax=Anaerosacchariphilus polymeriproducens TaxID=1812858 RepID=A0A371AZA1_9FIRM|nr:non-ribosomal peptide synthetase [Anaerosacchariphilus polymeriproducens]RDU24928.1 amino acid adenylation domain-containing protein [Anaerosacchariphilus polymeriproducens]